MEWPGREFANPWFEWIRFDLAASEGMTLTEIADALDIGCKTVANTCSHIKTKHGVTRTNDLIRLAMTLGVA